MNQNGSTHYFEKQNQDANSSNFHPTSPTTPSLPAPKIHHVGDEPDLAEEPELTSLSPPPRRGSKRISLPEVEPPPEAVSPMAQGEEGESQNRVSVENTDSNDPDVDNDKPFSLSRPGSVMSFGVVNV